MNQWSYFLFLLRQVYGADGILIPLFVLFLLAVVKNYWIDKIPYRAVHLLALVPFLFPIWMLIWGTLYEHTTSGTVYAHVNVPEWLSPAIWGIVVIQLLVNIGCLVYFKGVRLSIVILVLLQGLLTFISLLVSGMSIGGTWL